MAQKSIKLDLNREMAIFLIKYGKIKLSFQENQISISSQDLYVYVYTINLHNTEQIEHENDVLN